MLKVSTLFQSLVQKRFSRFLRVLLNIRNGSKKTDVTPSLTSLRMSNFDRKRSRFKLNLEQQEHPKQYHFLCQVVAK